MSDYTVSYHYAKALFGLASSSSDRLETQLKNIQEVVSLFKKMPQLEKLLTAPQIDRNTRESRLQSFFPDSPLDPLFLRFFSVVLEKKRLPYLPNIARDYHHIVMEHLGKKEITLITAIAIDEGTRALLRSKLEASYGKNILIKERINPHIIGGVVLLCGNQIIDWSLRGRLHRMQKSLLKQQAA